MLNSPPRLWVNGFLIGFNVHVHDRDFHSVTAEHMDERRGNHMERRILVFQTIPSNDWQQTTPLITNEVKISDIYFPNKVSG